MMLPTWFWVVCPLALGFAVAALIGTPIIRALIAKKMGQKILEIGPIWHKEKENTPTMGGFIFIISILLTVAGCILLLKKTNPETSLLPLAFSVIYAALCGATGFLDDYLKHVKKQNEGLKEIPKLILQTVSAIVFLFLMRRYGGLTTALPIPFTDLSFELGYAYYPIMILILDGFVNGTNITDGVDGLATTICSVILCLVILASVFVAGDLSAVLLSSAFLGGMLGFLVFNFHPAKVFMGDTGSLFFGGLLVGLFYMIGNPLLVILAGAVYVFEMLTSLWQKIYFKLTHGKRFFKMAPFHHHLEKSDWSENKIVAVFSGVTALFCVISWFGL